MRCAALVGVVLAAIAGCATPPPTGLAEVVDRPAEQALLTSLRAYDDGQYAGAEREAKAALAAGLQSTRERAEAGHPQWAPVYRRVSGAP